MPTRRRVDAVLRELSRADRGGQGVEVTVGVDEDRAVLGCEPMDHGDLRVEVLPPGELLRADRLLKSASMTDWQAIEELLLRLAEAVGARRNAA